MKLHYARTGLTVLSICSILSPYYVHAESTLYSRILDQVKQQQFVGELEPEVLKYTETISKKQFDSIDADFVKSALKNNLDTICEDVDCAKKVELVQKNARTVTGMRTFARDLQRIAASYEDGTVGLTGYPNAIAAKWPSVYAIWQSGYDKSTAPIASSAVRTAPRPESLDTPVEEVAAAFRALKGDAPFMSDKQVAAMYMFRHGSQKLIHSLPACSDDLPDPLTTDYLQKLRFCDLETKMSVLFTLLQREPVDPPAKNNETIIFAPFELTEEGVYIWMTNKEVGLGWLHSLEPVQTAFTDPNGVEINAKWDYADPPEEPDTQGGICSHAYARNGYLCRPISVGTCPTLEENCAKDPNTGRCFEEGRTIVQNVITITSCESQNFKGPVQSEVEGPNVCQVGSWLEEPMSAEFPDASQPYIDRDPAKNDDIAKERNECSNCVIDFYCSDSCPGGFDAFTSTKDDDGVIRICVPSGTMATNGNATYLLLHELVHAQQFCGLPPQTEVNTTKESCCATERQAYTVQCSALATDGILQAIGISIDDCASTLSNASCAFLDPAHPTEVCTTIKSDPRPLIQKIIDEVDTQKDVLKLPTTCNELVQKLDARAASAVMSTGRVCSPNCTAKYENTIGNNLCYIGQCIEQSLEEQRIVPGRLPLTTQDQAFPWDACMRDDPQLGSVIPLPSERTTTLPEYNPQKIATDLDTTLCIANGFPRLTPPVLCNFSVERQLRLSLSNPFQSALQLSTRFNESINETSINEAARKHAVTRIGSQLFTNYVKQAIPSVQEVLETVQSLLKQMGDVQFPTTMCPRFPVTDCSVFNASSSSSSSSTTP